MWILTGEEWWCLKVYVVHLETIYTRLNSFLKPIYQRILRICFTTSTRILFAFSFHVFFLNLVIPARSKALICTRKRKPDDSGRSSKMASSCQEGLNGVKRVAWNVQKINRVSWKREKINRVSWIIFVQISVLFVAFPKLWTIIWCMWSIWYF